MADQTQNARRTIRRFAHELYPHPGEWEIQPLAQAVPYLYARAVGLNVHGTDWFDLWRPEHKQTEPERAELTIRLTTARTLEMVAARSAALHADALLQGLSGSEAWEWAESRAADETGEWVYERAVFYGVPVEQIKPYPVLAERDQHDHLDDPDARGWRTVHRIDGKESECPDCTETVSDSSGDAP